MVARSRRGSHHPHRSVAALYRRRDVEHGDVREREQTTRCSSMKTWTSTFRVEGGFLCEMTYQMTDELGDEPIMAECVCRWSPEVPILAGVRLDQFRQARDALIREV